MPQFYQSLLGQRQGGDLHFSMYFYNFESFPTGQVLELNAPDREILLTPYSIRFDEGSKVLASNPTNANAQME